MAGKWWFAPQRETKEELENYETSSCLDQCITGKLVYEKFLVIDDGKPRVLLFEYTKVDYGSGYKVNKFEALQ